MVSAMRTALAATIISIAMVASPLAYGQASSGKGQAGTQGTSRNPYGSAVGGGDRALLPPTQPGASPSNDALRNLAGGGYADPNYVPPTAQAKRSTRHRVIRAPRARISHRLEQYSVNPAFRYGYCYCYCDY
jgi:hypothetical protein